MTKKIDPVEMPAPEIAAPSQQAFLEALGEEEEGYQSYLDQLSPKKKQRVWGAVRRLKTGLHAIAPIVCMGPEKCIFYERCPVPDRDSAGQIVRGPTSDYPIGRSCVLETYYMKRSWGVDVTYQAISQTISKKHFTMGRFRCIDGKLF